MEIKTVLTRLRTSFGSLLHEMRSARRVLVHEGGRAFIRRYGWKVVAGVIAYYIVRDVTLYVLLPLLLYKTATQT